MWANTDKSKKTSNKTKGTSKEVPLIKIQTHLSSNKKETEINHL